MNVPAFPTNPFIIMLSLEKASATLQGEGIFFPSCVLVILNLSIMPWFSSCSHGMTIDKSGDLRGGQAARVLCKP